MGYFRDLKHELNIYDAPKAGGTTLRSWILFKTHGDCMLGKGEYVAPKREHYVKLKDYRVAWFTKLPLKSICIKRDPVERFLSCYKDKILRENYVKQKYELEYFVDNFELMMKHPMIHPSTKTQPRSFQRLPYIWYHFAPQHKQFGKDLSYYDRVFSMDEINTSLKEYLEDLWKVNLPQIHTRKSKSIDLNVTEDLIAKIKDIYKEDYDLGWY